MSNSSDFTTFHWNHVKFIRFSTFHWNPFKFYGFHRFSLKSYQIHGFPLISSKIIDFTSKLCFFNEKWGLPGVARSCPEFVNAKRFFEWFGSQTNENLLISMSFFNEKLGLPGVARSCAEFFNAKKFFEWFGSQASEIYDFWWF